MTSAGSQLSDQRRVAYAANRDRFAEVYREYWPCTVGFISGRVSGRDRHLSEELAQETLMRAWPQLENVQDRGAGSLRRWLATIARGEVARYYTERGGRQHAREDPTGDCWRWDLAQLRAADPPAVVAAAGDGRSRLLAALEGLAPEVRQAVELHVANGMPQSAVAQIQGCEKSTARGRAARGVTALRKELAGVSPVQAMASDSTDPMVGARTAVAEVHQLVAGGEGRRAAEAVAALGDFSSEDPVARARSAVAQAHRRVSAGAGAGRHAGESARAQQLARWHVDDQATERQRGATAERGALGQGGAE